MGHRITKPVVIVPTFYNTRVERFIDSWHRNPPGHPCHVYFVHNCMYAGGNRTPDMDPDRSKTASIVMNCGIKDYFHVPRFNSGEDLGAQWEGYHKTSNEYDMYFFINEIVMFNKPGWLLAHIEAYDDPEIGATCPQICRGIRYPWCLRSTFWSARADVLKRLKWPEPKSHADAQIQEMELIYPHVKALGLNCKQVGDGEEWMNYYFDDGRPYKNYTFNKEVVL